MKIASIEIKPKKDIKNNRINVYVIQTSLDCFGKSYKKTKLFDYCYLSQEKTRLKEIIKQADNLFGFNNKTLQENL